MPGRLSRRSTPRAILWGTLAWHPAVKAWSAVTEAPAAPEAIEVLHQTDQSATYRLVGAGPGGAAVIARRRRTAMAVFERTFYRQILPHLSAEAPRYCGFTAESARFAWLFLTDRSRSPGARGASKAHA